MDRTCSIAYEWMLSQRCVNGPLKVGTAYLDLVLVSHPQLPCAEYVRNVLDKNILQGAGTQFTEEISACSSALVKIQAEVAKQIHLCMRLR